MVHAMANALALLRGYLDLTRAMKRSHIDRRIRERINLAGTSGSAATTASSPIRAPPASIGVPEDEVQLARQGTSRDPVIAAIVAFAQMVLPAPAGIGDAELERLRAHGYSDEQIAAVAGLVSLQLLTGAFNLIAAYSLG
jgi:alkylhydroperoxidase family enzyme